MSVSYTHRHYSTVQSNYLLLLFHVCAGVVHNRRKQKLYHFCLACQRLIRIRRMLFGERFQRPKQIDINISCKILLSTQSFDVVDAHINFLLQSSTLCIWLWHPGGQNLRMNRVQMQTNSIDSTIFRIRRNETRPDVFVKSIILIIEYVFCVPACLPLCVCTYWTKFANRGSVNRFENIQFQAKRPD